MPNKYLRLVLLLCFFSGLFFLIKYLGWQKYLTKEYIALLFSQHQLKSLLIYFNLFALCNLLYIPGWFLLAGAVYALGTLEGSFVTYLAGVYACTTNFLLFRYLGRPVIREFKIKWMNTLFKKLDEDPLRYVFFLRLFAHTSSFLNHSLSLSNLTFRNYFLATVIGLILPVFMSGFFIDQIIALFS
jgi:uncharacterized membrane protein YdjX (TVP38/TMEM64 family)